MFGKRQGTAAVATPSHRRRAPAAEVVASTPAVVVQKTNPADGGMTLVAAIGNTIKQHVVAAYTEADGAVHGETVIGALASLNGEYALRASGVDFHGSDGWMPGGLADGKLYGGERDGRMSVWTIVYGYALTAGASESAVPDIAEIARRAEAGIGGRIKSYPPLSVPKAHFPSEWSPNACVRFRDYVQQLAREESLSAVDTSMALAFALGFLVADTIKAGFDAEIALRLSAEIMTGVSRMAPLNETM